MASESFPNNRICLVGGVKRVFSVFKTGSPVAQNDDLGFVILLPPSSESWDNGHVLPCQVYVVLRGDPRALPMVDRCFLIKPYHRQPLASL